MSIKTQVAVATGPELENSLEKLRAKRKDRNACEKRWGGRLKLRKPTAKLCEGKTGFLIGTASPLEKTKEGPSFKNTLSIETFPT